MYVHTLTPLEIACGVTLDAVGAALSLSLSGDSARTVTVPANTPPALAGSVARAAFNGAAVEFSHLALGLYPVYRRA